MKCLNKKLWLIFLAIFLTSIISISAKINFNSNSQPSKRESEPLGNIQSSASPLSKEHQIVPVSILVYTEYVDEIGELVNTMQAIDNTYGTDYYYEDLTDYTDLGTRLQGHDILLIPEQELAPDDATMMSIGSSWSSILINFVNDGGIVILLDFARIGPVHGPGRHIYNESGLMTLKAVIRTDSTITSLNLVNTSDALARGVASSFPDLSGTISVDTDEAIVVIEDNNNDPVVVHKIMGRGHVIYMGFDLFSSDPNYENLLGNAIRLHRHVIFDESQNPLLNFFNEMSSFVDDLVSEGFAVSRMSSFDPKYLSASDVLVIIWGTIFYAPSKITAIETFVKNGGGLFIASDYSSYGHDLDPVLKRFGFGRNTTNYLRDSDDYFFDNRYIIYDNIVNHSITLDVNSVQFFTSTGFITLPSSAVPLILTDTDPTSTWFGGTPAYGVPVAAALVTDGNGRVVVCGDGNFLSASDNHDSDGTNDYNDEDNEVFAINNIRWLSAAGVEECIVLFDESKTPLRYLDGDYNTFGNYLTSNGYTLKWMDLFDPNLLDNVDILFISDGSSDYTISEINNITNFVASGGGLFLLGDWGSYGAQVDPIGIEFGIDINNTASYLSDSDDGSLSGYSYIIYNESNFGSHPITEGISRIEIDRGTGFTTIGGGSALITTDTDGTCVWYNHLSIPSEKGKADGVVVMTAKQYNLIGRIVFLTDIDFADSTVDPDGDGDSNFFDSDNERLIVNSFQWLSEAGVPSVGGGGGDDDDDDEKVGEFPWLLLIIIAAILGIIAIVAIILILKKKR